MSKQSYNFYPDVDDPDFYKKIYVKKEFNQNKIDIERRSFEEICNSKEFKLQLPENTEALIEDEINDERGTRFTLIGRII